MIQQLAPLAILATVALVSLVYWTRWRHDETKRQAFARVADKVSERAADDLLRSLAGGGWRWVLPLLVLLGGGLVTPQGREFVGDLVAAWGPVVGKRGGVPGGGRQAAAAPETDTLALTLFASRDGASDSTFSTGVPLRLGHLDSANVGSVRLEYNGTEVAALVEPLRGYYHDGSIISLRVQRKHSEAIAANDTITGYVLRFAAPDSSAAAIDSTEIKFVPDAFLRPDPSYYMTAVAGVMGPLVPIDSLEGDQRWLDSVFIANMNLQWEENGDSVDGTESAISTFEHIGSVYDPCLNSIRIFARGEAAKFIERGLKMCAVYRNDQEADSWGHDAHRQMGFGLAAAYWWTGYHAHRLAVYSIGDRWSDGNNSTVPAANTDGRNQARRFAAAMTGWMLDSAANIYGNNSRNARLQMDTVLQVEIIDRQITREDSTFGMIPDSVGLTTDAYYQANFGSGGIVSYYAALYTQYRGSGGHVEDIDTLISQQAQFLLTQVWDSVPSLYYYSWMQEDNHPGNPADRTALVMMETFPWRYSIGRGINTSQYETMRDSMFTKYQSECCSAPGEVFLEENAEWSQKHLHEGFYNYMTAHAAEWGLFS